MRVSIRDEAPGACGGNGLPLVNNGNVFGRIVPAPREPASKVQISATWRVVSPEYLDALRLRLTAGRLLTSTVIACVGPARRAARVDPIRALRMR